MALHSPALQAVRPDGKFDPQRPGDFPVLLGDSLKGQSRARRQPVSVRYNWKPSLDTQHVRATITSSDSRSFVMKLAADGETSTDQVYSYKGVVSSDVSDGDGGSPSQQSLALVFNKAKSAFVLEDISATLDFNLTSAPGKKDNDIRRLAQIDHQNPKLFKFTNGLERESPPTSDEEEPDPDNPYDYRHFIAEAREQIESAPSATIGNHTPTPGNLTPANGSRSPAPGSSKFLNTSGSTTPRLPALPTSVPTSKKRKVNDTSPARPAGTAPRSHPGPASEKTSSASQQRSGPSHRKHLSKERISDSDDELSDAGTGAASDSAAGPSKSRPGVGLGSRPRPGHLRSTSSQSASFSQAASAGARAAASGMASPSPRIVVDDGSGLEIDYGATPQPSSRPRQLVNPDAFASSRHGTPRLGSSRPYQSSPPYQPPAPKSVNIDDHDTIRAEARAHTRSGHGHPARPMLDDENDDDVNAADTDADIEELQLGSPQHQLPTPTQSMTQHLQHSFTRQGGAAGGDGADEEDDDDYLAAELEAALEQEDEREMQQQRAAQVGLGIAGIGGARGHQDEDDESEVSEEE